MRLDHLLSKEQAKTETSELHPKVDRIVKYPLEAVKDCKKHDRHAGSNTEE